MQRGSLIFIFKQTHISSISIIQRHTDKVAATLAMSVDNMAIQKSVVK